jgi:catechol 2,3-dioxygenase
MEMAVFYQKLSFDATLNMRSAVFMSHNKYHHHLAINGWNRASMIEHNDESVDIKEMVMTYPNKDSLLRVVDNLQKSGLDVLKDMDDYIVFDPIGIAVRLKDREIKKAFV